MASIRAELESGEIVELVKECGCLDELHQGPHWLHMDEVDRDLNAKLLDGHGSLSRYAFVKAEVRRLDQLEYEMRRRKIVRIIRPDGTELVLDG